MKYLLPFLLALFLVGASLEDARKANEAYENGNYEEAVSLYKKAIQAEPDNAKLYFNLGNALAKNGAPDEAIRYYEQYKQMTDDPNELAKADYNIGNIRLQAKKYDQAVEAYKEAMRREADDVDAKYNYELARQKKQQQQNKNQNNKNKDDQKKKQDQKKQQNKDQKNNQKQDDQQKQNKQNQNNQQKNQKQKNQKQKNENQQQKSQPKPTKISKAEAQKILNALEQQEKELLKEFKKQKTESTNTKHEKDW